MIEVEYRLSDEEIKILNRVKDDPLMFEHFLDKIGDRELWAAEKDCGGSMTSFVVIDENDKTIWSWQKEDGADWERDWEHA